MTRGRPPADIAGKRFGRLVALRLADRLPGSETHREWICVCDCGNGTIIRGDSLRSGHTESCGCLAADMRAESASLGGQALAMKRLELRGGYSR